MDLTPIYELRERLRAGAIAGTELIAEDFRLKKAVDAVAPLEKASPVFARIGQLARTVVIPDCPDRPEALLDALTLVDAVLCTQGAVAVKAPLEPVPLSTGGSAVTNAPYSVLAGLLDALTGSGGGRYSLVMDTHSEHPELFEDYRIKSALVGALGASYSELADTVAEWLKGDGIAVLPLLQKDFDPKGKKEMVRRIQVMEAVAGARANDFYLSRLADSEKEVRGALIYALRHSPANAEILLELTKTEKGSNRKMAFWALAQLDEPQVWECWAKLLEKKPAEYTGYLEVSDAPAAGKLLAETLLRLLAPYEERGERAEFTKKTADTLEVILHSLIGKAGPEVCVCFRRAAALGAALDRPWEGYGEPWTLDSLPATAQENKPLFSQAVPAVMLRTLSLNPDPQLACLAIELGETYGRDYLSVDLIGRLLTCSKEKCYNWTEALLERKTLLGAKIDKENRSYAACGLSYVCRDESGYALESYRIDPVYGEVTALTQPLRENIDERFPELLMRCCALETDYILARWITPEDPVLCAKLGNYFYKRALAVADNRNYMDYLRQCGWNDCSGLAVHYCKARGRLGYWEIWACLGRLPGDREAVAEEAEKILALVKKGEIKVTNMDAERFRRQIEELRAGGVL